jgi:hypothetical protein
MIPGSQQFGAGNGTDFGANARDECMDRWRAFERDPSDENRELLRAAYLAVPKHLRIYCGDLDSKDYPIRRALGLTRYRRED